MEFKEFLQHTYAFLKKAGFSIQEIERRIRLIAIVSQLNVEPKNELEHLVDLRLNRGLDGQAQAAEGLAKVELKCDKKEPSEQKQQIQDLKAIEGSNQFQEKGHNGEIDRVDKQVESEAIRPKLLDTSLELEAACGQPSAGRPARKLAKKFKRNIYISGSKLDKCVLSTGLKRATILSWFRRRRLAVPLTDENMLKALKYIRRASPEARDQELEDLRVRASMMMDGLHEERDEIGQLKGELMEQMIETQSSTQDTPPPETNEIGPMATLESGQASVDDDRPATPCKWATGVSRRHAAKSAEKAISSLYNYWDDY